MLVALLLCTSLITGFYFTFIKNQLPRYREVRQQLEDTSFKLEANKRLVERFSELEKKNKALKDELERTQKPFDIDAANGINYYFMGRYALDASVDIIEVIPQPLVDKEQYLELPLDLKIRGQYLDILQFFEMLELDLPSASEIRYMTMKPAAESGGHNLYPNLEAHLQIITYSTQTPKAMKLAQEWNLGRFDIFSPTVEIDVDSAESEVDEQNDKTKINEPSPKTESVKDTKNNTQKNTEKIIKKNQVEEESSDYFPQKDNNYETGIYKFPVKD